MIKERIVLIKNYFDELENVDKGGGEARIKYYARSMLLFSIINAAISLAEDMIAAKNLKIPGNYADMFDILSQAKVIDQALADDMKMLVKLRNMIAHEYEGFDERAITRFSGKVWSVKSLAQIAAKMEKK